MIAVRRVLARVRREGEAGFTLVELLTVMVLGSVIGVAVTSAMVSGLKSQTRVNAHQTSLEQTRVAMQRVTREIRNVAPYKSLLLAQDNDIKLNQARTGGYRTLELYTATSGATTSLMMSERDYSGTGCSISNQPACTTSSTKTPVTILPSLANGSGSPLFSYTPYTGYTSTDSSVSSSTCVWSGHTPTTYAPECPGKVTIHLMQLIDGAPTNRPTDLSDTVELRNQGS